MNASAGSVRRCHPVPRCFVTRNVTCPSSHVSKRLVVRAIREREGAQYVRTSVPVPAGLQWVTPSVCQTWGGTGSQRPAVVSAALHVPRKSLARADGHKPGRSAGREPLQALGGQGPTRDEGMDMRRRGEVPGPRMEDASHTDLPAEGRGVQRECLQSSRRGLQEQGGEAVLRRAGHRAQCLGQRAGDEQGRDRQEQRPLLFQPACGRCMLTRGAMPVLSRMRAVLQCSARRALGEMPAQSLGPALCPGRHGGQVAREHAVGALRSIGGAMTPEDCRQLSHGRPPTALSARAGGD